MPDVRPPSYEVELDEYGVPVTPRRRSSGYLLVFVSVLCAAFPAAMYVAYFHGLHPLTITARAEALGCAAVALLPVRLRKKMNARFFNTGTAPRVLIELSALAAVIAIFALLSTVLAGFSTALCHHNCSAGY